jgi:hypothetical protein
MKQIRKLKKPSGHRWLLVTMATLATACGGGSSSVPAPEPVPAPKTYTVGGTLSGLASGTEIVLTNSGKDNLTVKSDGSFTFSTAVTANGSYDVAVATQPANQNCTASNAIGTGLAANITGVQITCVTTSHQLGGTVTGLGSGRQLALQNNAGTPLTLATNGSFLFAGLIPENSAYAVTVATQPPGQICSVTGGSGTMDKVNVASIAVNCVSSRFMYITQDLSDTIAQYVVGADGTPSPLPVATVAAGTNPLAVVLDPTNRFFYVTNAGDSSVSQ